jgi:hypothetical protein
VSIPDSGDEPRSAETVDRSGRPARPPNYFAPAAQRRLLTLVAMLTLVLLLMDQAGRPERWQWLWHISGERPPATSQPVTAAVETSSEARGKPGVDRGWPAGLDPDVLSDVRDNSHFRRAEQPAWFGLWRLLRDTSSEQLRRQSLGEVSYLQIARQTDAYRGRLVNLKGTIRRANWVSAPANDLSITGYTQCWLFPELSDTQPIVLYVLDWPQSLPAAVDLALPAAATGIVYKRWSYLGAEGMEVAPVVLAKTVSLLPSPPVPKTRPPGRSMPLLAVLGTGIASLLVTALLLRYSAHRYRRSERAAELPEALPDLSAFNSGPRLADAAGAHGEHHRSRAAGADDERLS